jgi:hypothetical protein
MYERLRDFRALGLPFLFCTLMLLGWALPGTAQLQFTDVAEQLGLADVGSCAMLFWYDYDNDGDLDLLQPRRFDGNTVIFRNDGDHFTRLTDIGLPTGLDAGAAWPMDIDHDGDFDLFFGEYHTTSQMLMDEGGVFVDRSAAMGLNFGTGCRDYKWIDFDRDGWMDLLYGDLDGFRLFRNVEGTHFEDVTEQSQLPSFPSFHRMCEADVDLDGDIDMFATSIDSGDRFYINTGNGVFEDRTVQSGLSAALGRGGCAWADFNHDKYPDLLTQGPQRHAIWLNNGDGTFTEATVHGTETDFNYDWPYACDYAVADYNMDGLYDFYCCRPGGCGDHLSPNQLFVQDSIVGTDIYFHDIAHELGMDMIEDGAPSVADFDDDGDMDLFITVHNGANRLYRNDSPHGMDAFQVRVTGPNGEEDQWHSRVEIYEHGTTHLVGSSELNTSNVARNGFKNYFVLNNSGHYDLWIYSPSGGVMDPSHYPELSNVVPSQIQGLLTVHWGEGAASGGNTATPQPGEFRLDSAYPNPFNASSTLRYSVPGDGMVKLAVFDVLGRHVTDLVNGAVSRGEHRVIWNAGNLASGVYIVQLSTGNLQARQKLVLLK